MIPGPIVIYNLLTPFQIKELGESAGRCQWYLAGTSMNNNNLPKFWHKPLDGEPVDELFKKRITNVLKLSDQSLIKTLSIYLNGQGHSQCGDWHIDSRETEGQYKLSLIYFFDETWQPEYGGHLLVKNPNTSKISSYLPEFNMGVIIDSTWWHVGLEPTIHCKTQRVSLAWKFQINKSDVKNV